MTASFLDVRRALSEIEPDLGKLRNRTLLDVCLDERIGGESISEVICRSFKRLAKCNSRNHNETTGASKILHIINPNLFAMWDGRIREGYICRLKKKDNWIWYTEFLQEMQNLAKCAIKQVKANERHHSDETAIASLTGCKHSLAKALDEYNYVNFTLPLIRQRQKS